jgi:transcriptional regulator with XRE-family HTH domain
MERGEVGERLMDIRKGQGLSKRALGRRSGVHYNTISGVEAGTHAPQTSTLEKLAEALDVDVEDLTGAPKGGAPQSSPEEVRRELYLESLRSLPAELAEVVEEATRRGSLSVATVEAFDTAEQEIWTTLGRALREARASGPMPNGEAAGIDLVYDALYSLRSAVDMAWITLAREASGVDAEVLDLALQRRQERIDEGRSRVERSAS